ncbi:uncharacterized protein LOC113146096 [Mastacembelus armatus]|uniref:uncharacterized protein LOC113146096 n=1 Tax=Mastacembelus armatus TaxID=205130 RepID=UPI000E454576|nr:uncharacterized protein LOC113146096 [Mastacembelus armatus]
MKLLHTLVILFFLSLQDRSTAQSITYIGTTGGQITVKCSESFQTSWKTFCKDPCNRNILIQTTGVRAHSGRYSIKYERGHFSVSITELIKSDSGRYRCGVSSAPYVEFGITVVDALLEGDYDPAERPIHTRTGGDLTVACSFAFPGSMKLFCKGECDEGDVLVRTGDDSATSDRYSIEHTRASGRGVFLFVTITQLRQSDSGWYSCALGRTILPDSSWEFNVIVTDAPHETPGPLSTSVLSTSVPSTSTGFTELSSHSEQPHTAGGPTGSVMSEVTLLYVGLTLLGTVLLLSLGVLLLCRRRFAQHKDAPVEPQSAPVTEHIQTDQDFREQHSRGREPPVEISSIYTYAKYTGPDGIEADHEYSSVPAAWPQHEAEDDLNELTYTKVDFSSRTAGSLHSAPRGRQDDVIYSEPRVAANCDSSQAGDDPPLYATIGTCQL